HRHIKRRFVKSAGFQNLRHASRRGTATIPSFWSHSQI
ncbi:IS6 family transposase, partial [Bacillus wiedmannii]|nr:IS6 family transposase [Bacillus wiedmannii]